MDAYALAKLIASVEEVDSRKRIQKCIFLLQTAGCDLGAEFHLHYYGPYSRDVANATDLLAQGGVLHEEARRAPVGQSYAYRITDKGTRLLKEYEAIPEGKQAAAKLAPHIPKFQDLREVLLWTLELAATIAFFRTKGGLDWDTAAAKTAEFKQVVPGATVMVEAERLARSFVRAG